MLARARRIAHRFVPTRDIFYSSAIDLTTAGAIWLAWSNAPTLPPLADKLINYAIHVLILMAIWNPLQHMRRMYHSHVRQMLWLLFVGSRDTAEAPTLSAASMLPDDAHPELRYRLDEIDLPGRVVLEAAMDRGRKPSP